MIRSGIAEWLVHCADPEGAQGQPPRRLPTPEMALKLVNHARSHGVLGAVLRQFPPFVDDPSFAAAGAVARKYHRENLTLSMMLRHQADELLAAAKALPVAVVKGPVFARTLYPDPALRSFTDLDILAAPDAVPALGGILQAQGFFLAEYGPQPQPQEWKWVHREHEILMIEVQTDLIHATSLRNTTSLTYEVIADGPEMPAALLLIALIHGGAHHYDRLRQVIDICQAGRALSGSNEEQRFADLVVQTRAQLIAVAGLTLAGRTFDEPRCLEIARALGPARFAGLARLLLDRTVVTSATTDWRTLHSWRRQAFRLLVKLGPRT
jgi:Uncharacterised nucleotidyltransferase